MVRTRATGLPTVCTVLMAPERARIEAAGSGYFDAVHRDSVPAAMHTVRRRSVDAILLSVHRCNAGAVREVGALVREFPAMPTVAIVSRYDPVATETLLRLGASGVRSVVDLTARAGWQRLREIVAHPASPVVARILGRLHPALSGSRPDLVLFFEIAARLAPVVATVRELSRHMQISPSTLMSRFFRARLPSPKSFLAWMRLLHAAYLFETPGLSVGDVAYRLDFSSPQSFGRHLKGLLGVTPTEFRHRYPFARALDHFLAIMIEPYWEGLCRFHPLNHGATDWAPYQRSDTPSHPAARSGKPVTRGRSTSTAGSGARGFQRGAPRL